MKISILLFSIMLQVNLVANDNIEKICKRNGTLVSDFFSNKILKTVNFNKDLRAPIRSLFKDLGKCSKVEFEKGKFTFNFSKHILKGTFLEEEGKLVSIWFDSPRLKNKNIKNLLKTLEQQGRDVSYYFTDGTKKLNKNIDKKLNIASSFKLKLLLDLKNCVQDKICSYDDHLILEKNIKTSPSGILQDWPNNTKLLVSTAAHLMISLSDNTATDLVIHYLNKLKKRKRRTMQKRFIDLYSPKSKSFGPKDYTKVNLAKYAIQGGSIGTTFNLCQTMLKLSGTPTLTINQDGLGEELTDLHFKGGSRFGVYQKTYAWKTKEKSWSCLSITINDSKGVNEEKVSSIIREILL
ncbi:hypothetical protein A9Q84_03080 [Halobacteriovorax marinus]|uniref:Beta-lactamase class A catalytic domain-containing protein n=1 Tax=Halobacteriovorax marinus TaxID=97084 RepID=A0A1Y5FCU4_9BACT|nr:hypothetical protein A9Q84_03080 [Halobacteriovorax marinus]